MAVKRCDGEALAIDHQVRDAKPAGCLLELLGQVRVLDRVIPRAHRRPGHIPTGMQIEENVIAGPNRIANRRRDPGGDTAKSRIDAGTFEPTRRVSHLPVVLEQNVMHDMAMHIG